MKMYVKFDTTTTAVVVEQGVGVEHNHEINNGPAFLPQVRNSIKEYAANGLTALRI